MTPFDETSVFVKVDKLRDRMARLGKHTRAEEWQETRLLIRALTESIVKLQKPSTPSSRRVHRSAPDLLSDDWEELVDALVKKGVKLEK